MKKTAVNKKVRNATPCDYEGIDFKSKLEVYCYKKLRDNNIKAEYEAHRYTLLKPFEFNGEKVRAMTYTPDFVGEGFVIECKGQMNDAFPLRWKMFKHFLYRNGINVVLYLPRNQKQINTVIEDILKKQNERKAILPGAESIELVPEVV